MYYILGKSRKRKQDVVTESCVILKIEA